MTVFLDGGRDREAHLFDGVFYEVGEQGAAEIGQRLRALLQVRGVDLDLVVDVHDLCGGRRLLDVHQFHSLLGNEVLEGLSGELVDPELTLALSEIEFRLGLRAVRLRIASLLRICFLHLNNREVIKI